MIDPGSLNKRITLRSPATEQDIYGQPAKVWNDVLSTWAGIRAATGKEVYAVSGFVAQMTHVITIRYRTDVQVIAAMRVMYRTRVFQIQAVSDPTEGEEQLNLLCLEINDGV